MSVVTERVSKFVRDKGINLSNLANKTGIPYNALQVSLNTNGRDRDLRDDELLAICSFLNINPMMFADQKEG